MNIFYYAIQKTNQSDEVYTWLKSLSPPLDIQQLPSGKGLSSRESLNLRNGDLLIIFIRNQGEIRELMKQQIESSNYKICLLFEKQDQELIRKGLLFNPRHYSSMENSYIGMEETVRKIVEKNQ